LEEPKVRISELYYASVLGAIYGSILSAIISYILSTPPVPLTPWPFLNQIIMLVLGFALFVLVTLFTIRKSVRFLRFAFRFYLGNSYLTRKWPFLRSTLGKED
jgi:uncharacterized protein YacL